MVRWYDGDEQCVMCELMYAYNHIVESERLNHKVVLRLFLAGQVSTVTNASRQY